MQKEEINAILFSRHSSVKCSKGKNISLSENIPTLQKIFSCSPQIKAGTCPGLFYEKICKRNEIPPVESHTDDKGPGPSCLRKG